METVRFICEFFFGNLWHWLGLVIIVMIICGRPIVGLGDTKTKI